MMENEEVKVLYRSIHS